MSVQRLVVALLSLGAVVLTAGCGGPSDEAVEWTVIEKPDATTYQLRARFGGSSCTDFKEWQVEQTDEHVKVSAIVTFSGEADCTADEVFEPYTLRLSEPLGNRKLVGCDPPTADDDCSDVVPPVTK